MLISLSILEYEPELSNYVNNITEAGSLSKILKIIDTGKIHRIHVDVMRPPMIPNEYTFPKKLIKMLYKELNKKVLLAFHLMVKDPFFIIKGINELIPQSKRTKTLVIIQRESYISEKKMIYALQLLKNYGYKVGLCLDLPSPSDLLTKKIVEKAEVILLMTAPMGKGGQKYSFEATKRIMVFHETFFDKTIMVDGGIGSKTILLAEKAGAKEAVVGSFITKNKNPEKAVVKITEDLKSN
jgi:pentose-5-phosphate-3-epimerase